MHPQTLAIWDNLLRTFFAIDCRDWTAAERGFMPTIAADYSRLFDKPAATVPRQTLFADWQSHLPGFQYLQHFLSNPMIDADEQHPDSARCTCYVVAEHYLPNEITDPFWIIKGTYTFQLTRQVDYWCISALTLYPAAEYGDRKLLDLARTAVQASPDARDN
jgi:hypothetical protein